jgi:hypothetical protein
MRYFIAIALMMIAPVAFAQTGVPPVRDSSANSEPNMQRPLPPSMLAELRRSQKDRTFVYQDTLHAADLEREHFNDSVSREYADSAISMIDTAVSLSHKEWLDSELIEIPELARFGERVHYNYPPSLVMETDLRSVPFDSTLTQQMNPVTRENLPYFDQSPIPMPMQPLERSESFLEAGGGNVALPRVAGWFAQSLSERSAMNLSGTYQSLDATQSAIHSFGNFLASLNTQLGEDPANEAYQLQDLQLQAGYAVKSVATNNISTTGRTLGQFSALASIGGDLSKDFHYDARLEDHELSDGLSTGTTESSQNAALGTRFDVSNFHVLVKGNYSLATLFADTSVQTSNLFSGPSTPIHAQSLQALLGERNHDSIEWYAGLEYLGGTGVDGSNYSSLLPVLRGRMELNPLCTIGASFEPQVQLASLCALVSDNPFYAPELVLQSKESNTSISVPVDDRSVVMDKVNLAAFMNYILSPDDELRIEARYITRDREPIFNAITPKDSSTVFTVTPESTERFELTAAGNFLLFTRDVLSGFVEYCSATIASGGTIPFEPNAKLDLEYHFNSIWNNVQPALAAQMISRPGQTFTFLDVNVDAQLSYAITLTASIENIFGGASDFWPGYPEKPRSIWATVRYVF